MVAVCQEWKTVSACHLRRLVAHEPVVRHQQLKTGYAALHCRERQSLVAKTPIAGCENANRWSRKRQSFLVESSIVSRWYLARHSLLFRSFFACSSFGPRSVFDRLTTNQRETNERRTRT